MKIGVWGDSITYGEGDKGDLGWVGRLDFYLKTNKKGEAQNFGIPGETTLGLIGRFQLEVQILKPDIIIFAIGINDSVYNKIKDENRVSIERFGRNVSLLVSEAKRFTDIIYIIGLTKVDEEKINKDEYEEILLNTEIQKYNEELQKLCEIESLIFVNMFDVLDPQNDLDDGLHPNDLGYEKMFEVIQNILEIDN
jgi:lysophospholipase L1-like esterase